MSVASLLRACVAGLLYLTELAEPVDREMPCLQRNTQAAVRVCVAFLLRVSVAVLLELTELAEPVEMARLCCNTQAARVCQPTSTMGSTEVAVDTPFIRTDHTIYKYRLPVLAVATASTAGGQRRCSGPGFSVREAIHTEEDMPQPSEVA